MKRLLTKIEKKRKRMALLVSIHGLASPKTIKCSQQLDHLLNELNKKDKPFL